MYVPALGNRFAKPITQINSDLVFREGVASAGWTSDLWTCKNDECLRKGTQTRIRIHTRMHRRTLTHFAVRKLIMHGAHLVHMQAFGRQLMSLSDEPRGTHHFLTPPVVEWWWLSSHLPGFANEREDFFFWALCVFKGIKMGCVVWRCWCV